MDYRGFDSCETQDLIKSNAVEFEKMLRGYYIDRVNSFHKISFLANSAPFRFYYEENCTILVFIFPYEYNYNIKAEIFFLSTPNIREVKSYVITHEDMQSLDSYSYDYIFINEYILPKLGYHSSQIIITESCPYQREEVSDFTTKLYNLEYIDSIFGSLLRQNLKNQIREDIQQFKKTNLTELSYFAKEVAKFPFSLMDLKVLLQVVNDEDFSYQLDQAMAAYHQNLYLPCAATLGVCLETLCLKICEKHGLKVKGGETQLGKLKERLSSEKIISKRDNGRLEIAYKMRNLASHTSPGETLKEDCHFMLAVMNEIAHQHLQPKR